MESGHGNDVDQQFEFDLETLPYATCLKIYQYIQEQANIIMKRE